MERTGGGSPPPSSSTNDRTGGDAAESLFFALLGRTPEDEEPDVEPLCRQHPDLADRLRDLARRLGSVRRGLRSIGPLPEEPPAAPRSRYEIRGELARGGMGAILEVWDAELNRVLAMKVLRSRRETHPPTAIELERRRSRLLSEAQILGQLEHPSIVPVHEVGRDETGDVFFTMRLVRGGDLEEVLRRLHDGDAEWRLPRVVRMVQQVCEAVAHAHSRGVIHRDLKPANVMVGPFGETYVMDWGLAKARGRTAPATPLRIETLSVGPSQDGCATPASSASIRTARRDTGDSDPDSPLLTLEGEVVGTAAYMPPEQAAGRVEQVDERSDVYSAGAILYHVLAGRRPYARPERATHRERLQAVIDGPPEPLERAAARMPPELASIAQKAMHRDRSRRYATMHEMAEDLRAWLEGRVVRAHRTGPVIELWKWSQRHRLAVAALGALLVTLIAGSISLAILYRQSEQRRKQATLAQADALRRQSAALIWGASLASPSFTEDFSEPQIGPRWNRWGAPDDIIASEGRLHLRSARGHGTVLRMDPTRGTLRGDFDVSFRYELEDFTVPEAVRGERIFGLRLGSYPDRFLGAIGRHAERDSGVTPGHEHTYRAVVNEKGPEGNDWVPAEDLAGQLRITRHDGRVQYWYEADGEWRALGAPFEDSRPLYCEVFARDFYEDSSFVAHVDDLRVQTWTPFLGERLPDLLLDFEDGTLDGRLSLVAEAGIAAVLDGRLYLEKAPRRSGGLRIEIDPARFAMTGDFSVACDLALESVDLPSGGEARVWLQVLDTAGAPFGNLEVLASKSSRVLRAGYLVEAAEVEWTDAIRRVRLRRVGTTLLHEYWDGRWHTLLERPHVQARSFFFRLWVTSKAEDAAMLVAVDDLELHSTPER